MSPQPTPGADAAAVEVRDLRVAVQGRTGISRDVMVLRDVSFTAPRGRVTGIVGTNGAGKTTLLRALIGALAPVAGEIRVLAQPMGASEDRLPLRVGVVPDAPALPGDWTGERAADLHRETRRGFDGRIFLELLRERRLPLSATVKSLSSGQATHFSLALALAGRPELLILDEPLARLDPLARPEMLDDLRAFMAEGEEERSILISTHDLEEMDRFVDHLVVLHEGRVICEGDVVDLLEEHLLATVEEGALAASPGLLRGVRSGADVTATGSVEGLVRVEDAAALPPSAAFRSPQLREIVAMTLREAQRRSRRNAAHPEARR